MFCIQKKLGRKFVWVKKKIWSEISLSQKKLCWKCFGSKKNLGLKFFWVKKHFGRKFFCRDLEELAVLSVLHFSWWGWSFGLSIFRKNEMNERFFKIATIYFTLIVPYQVVITLKGLTWLNNGSEILQNRTLNYTFTFTLLQLLLFSLYHLYICQTQPQPPPSATSLTVAGPCHSVFELSWCFASQWLIRTASLTCLVSGSEKHLITFMEKLKFRLPPCLSWACFHIGESFCFPL